MEAEENRKEEKVEHNTEEAELEEKKETEARSKLRSILSGDKKKYAIFVASFVIFLLIASGFFYFSGKKAESKKNEIKNTNMSIKTIKTLGAIKVNGSLPGYDFNNDGKADYLESGLFPYVEAFNKGGFDYEGAEISFTLQGNNYSLKIPAMKMHAKDMAQSTVGSYVIFEGSAKDENEKEVSLSLLVKTLGREVTVYEIVFLTETGQYSFTDLPGESSPGEFEEKEIRAPGIIRFE